MSKHRSFVFTHHNYVQEHIDYYTGFACRYLIVGEELCPTTNGPHLQGYISFKNPRSLGKLRKDFVGADVRPARGSASQNYAYCSKSGYYHETGERPADAEDGGRMEIERWDAAREMAKQGLFEEIPSDIYLRCYSTIHRIHMDSRTSLPALSYTTGVWLIGSSGCGKSFGARTEYPDLFSKPLNKWYDAYKDQETVLLEDVDPSTQWIGNFLKHWADHYSFIAECKGKSREIRPKRLLVTAQYTIRECFGSGEKPDDRLVEALERRFIVIRVVQGQPIDWGPVRRREGLI